MTTEVAFIIVLVLFAIGGLFIRALKTEAGQKTAIHLLSRWFK